MGVLGWCVWGVFCRGVGGREGKGREMNFPLGLGLALSGVAQDFCQQWNQ